MFANPFDGPRAKVSRARRHLAELITIQTEYAASQPFSTDFHKDEEGKPTLFVKLTGMPPLDAATVASDILGNLRSSLDLAVNAAAHFDGETDLRNTYFHFAQTEAEWDKSYKGRTRAAPSRVIAVNRALSPWQNGNKLLYALSKLAATDKHQLLVPLMNRFGEAKIDGVRVGSETGMNYIQAQIPNFTELNQELPLMVFAPNSDADVTGPIDIRPGFAFGDVDIVSRQPVIPLVNQLCTICENIIQRIETVTRQ